MKDFLLNKDINEKRAGWITKVMEYDMDINITELVRAKGLYEEFLSSFDKKKEVALLIEIEQQLRMEIKMIGFKTYLPSCQEVDILRDWKKLREENLDCSPFPIP